MASILSVETPSYMECAMTKQSLKGVTTFSSDESIKSCAKGKIRDCRITELEDKLAVAEDRCSVLRQQVAYMKMLYTSSHQIPCTSDEEPNEKNEETVRNSISNPMCYRAEVDNYFNLPANMIVKPLSGTTLTKDPKEAMQLIVNEMTQSVNAMEGSINIHSNTIENMVLSTRNQRKRQRREDNQAQKIKRAERGTLQQSRGKHTVPLHREGVKTSAERSVVRIKSLKSLGSKSKISGATNNTGKKKANSKLQACSTKPRKTSSDVRVRDKTKKTLTRDKSVQDSQKHYNEGETVPKVTSSTYLLPTLSYRMKCVPKRYRPEFSFHRIPFVLGKSTNKSHNIGAKIQETLSLIKLSRKGLHSAGNHAKKEELTNMLQSSSTTEPHGVEMSNTVACESRQSNARSPMTVGASTDYKNYQLRTVLMNLHDEFSKMTENYEVLKDTLKDNDDAEMAQKVQHLEDELNAKEIEINAFMNLYNEVSTLKDRLSSNRGYSQPNSIYRPSTAGLTESTSCLKMTRLLRRIEQFQVQLKNMPYL